MKRYTITMKDGTQLRDLSMNGSMFVSQEEISPDLFTPERMKKVTIVETDEDGQEKSSVILKAVNDGVKAWPEGYLFNIREMTKDEAINAGLLELAEVVYGGLM